VKSAGSTAVGAAKTVANVAVQTAIAPVKYSTEAALDLGGTVISQFTPVISQAAGVATNVIGEAGQVGAQVAGAAAGATQGILTSAGQAISAAKGNTVAPAPPSNLPLYLGAAGAAGLLLFAVLRRKSRT
jgi:MYXO-CTERM domain-containing protein